MKAISCTLIINTRNGYCMTPSHHDSIKAAVSAAKESFGFAYRIFNKKGQVIKRGFCE